MNHEEKRKTFKTRLRSFSDEVFRNYLIMRKRWEISALERQRNVEIKDLGNRVYRLIQRKKIEIPDVDRVVSAIQSIDSEIQLQEERLRELIIRADFPKQISGRQDIPDTQPKSAESSKSVLDPESASACCSQESSQEKPDNTSLADSDPAGKSEFDVTLEITPSVPADALMETSQSEPEKPIKPAVEDISMQETPGVEPKGKKKHGGSSGVSWKNTVENQVESSVKETSVSETGKEEADKVPETKDSASTETDTSST